METVSHDGRGTAYRVAGGPADADGAVLYVHGSGATHLVWGARYGPDGPARPAVAVDLSGHGGSDDVDTDPGPETLASYARDVLAVAEATGAEVLAGNSLGGAVCLRVACETEFEPSALVLAGTCAKLTVHEGLRTWLAEDFDRAVEFLHGPDRLFHDAGARELERSKRAMRETGQRVTHRDFLTCHRFDARDRLGEVSAPTLAIVGEHDRLTPPSCHEDLAEHTGGEYATVPDAAHLAMVERPGAFDRVIASFLDRVGERR